MVPQFTSVPTNHAVRPLLPAPCPVTLPVLLTNIIPEQFPYPRILTDIDTSRTPTPPPGSRRTPTPAPPPRHPTPDTRDSSLTPMGSDDEGSDSSFTPKSSSSKITRPSGTNIQTVKSLFRDLYPDLTEEEQGKEYTAFRVRSFHIRLTSASFSFRQTRLDTLCARYLRASLAFSHQDKDEVYKVYKKVRLYTIPLFWFN